MKSKKIKTKKKMTTAVVQVKDELLSIPECRASRTSLEFSSHISKERFEKIGREIFGMKRRGTILFWLGDFINHGKDNDKALDVVEAYYKDGSVKNAAYVCRRIEPSRRREKLTFAHNQEIAPFSPEEQDKWLNQAEWNHYSAKVLRRMIREARLELGKENNEDDSSFYISTQSNAYSYVEYIDLCNKSVRSLLRKIRRLNEFKYSSEYCEKVRPSLCRAEGEKSFVKNCARLFWHLEWLLDEHLTTLAVLSARNGADLLLEDLYEEFKLPTGMRKHYQDGNVFNEIYYPTYASKPYIYEDFFFLSIKMALMLNDKIRYLIKSSKEFFLNHYESDNPFFIDRMGRFRFSCYALVLHLLDLFKIINEHIPNSLDKDTVGKIKKDLFDLDTEEEKQKSEIQEKLKELLRKHFMID